MGLGTALLAAGLVAAGAPSENTGHVVVDPHVVKTPTAQEAEPYLPANMGRDGGLAHVRCLVTVAGTLETCTLLDETPLNAGVGAAALAVAPLFLMSPRTVDGVPVGGAPVVLPIPFDPKARRAEDKGHVITNPHWLKLPSADDMANFWPANGLTGGSARILCVVTSRGALDRCSVLSESPEHSGFGAAALLMAPLFLMAPRTVDGAPVGGATVAIPVRFSGGRPVPPGARITVARGLAWGVTPTAAELAEAFPKDAAGHAAKAHVVLRCQVDSSGGLRDCSIMTEQPSGLGFGRAARALSKRFRIFDDPDYANTVKGDYVDIPFDFHDPAQQQPPLEVLDPTWLQTVDPVKASQLFPEAAAKAGLTTGRATLVCQVAHDGSLTACTVAEELPSGLGFGEAALAIAAVMKMNPWTQQGFPVDGAKIRLPIRVNLVKTDPSATATKP